MCEFKWIREHGLDVRPQRLAVVSGYGKLLQSLPNVPLPERLPRDIAMNTQASETVDRLGNVVLSPGAGRLVSRLDLVNAIRQHFQTRSDERPGRDSFRRIKSHTLIGCRLLSVHRTSRRQSFLLITEADQSFTSVLLPQEF